LVAEGIEKNEDLKKYLAFGDIAQSKQMVVEFVCTIVDDSFNPADPLLQKVKSLKISEQDFEVFYNLFCTSVKKTKPIKMPIFKKLFTTINSLRESLVWAEDDGKAAQPEQKLTLGLHPFGKEEDTKKAAERIFALMAAEHPEFEQVFCKAELDMVKLFFFDCLRLSTNNPEELKQTVANFVEKLGFVDLFDKFLQGTAKYCSTNNIPVAA
jgi:hypothetical protein